MQKISEMKEELAELATLLNQFKSEAVQLRILEHLFDEGRQDGKAASSGTRATSVTSQVRRLKIKQAKKTNSEKPKKAAGQGPYGTLLTLIDAGFFDQHRTIGEIIEYSRVNLARTFKASDFSGKLVRLVRAKALSRQKNGEGQYEYKKQ